MHLIVLEVLSAEILSHIPTLYCNWKKSIAKVLARKKHIKSLDSGLGKLKHDIRSILCTFHIVCCTATGD
jgi:hypothetical protein